MRRSDVQVHGVLSDPQTITTTGSSAVSKALHASLREKKEPVRSCTYRQKEPWSWKRDWGKMQQEDEEENQTPDLPKYQVVAQDDSSLNASFEMKHVKHLTNYIKMPAGIFSTKEQPPSSLL